MPNFDQKDANGWATDLATEQRAEQLLNDAVVIGDISGDLASSNETALNVAILEAIHGDNTKLTQMFWGMAIVKARIELDYDNAA